MLINNYKNNLPFGGHKISIDPDDIDELIFKTIKEERIKNNGIKYFSELTNNSVMKKFKKDLQTSHTQFIIDDNIFFVKSNEQGDLYLKKIKNK